MRGFYSNTTVQSGAHDVSDDVWQRLRQEIMLSYRIIFGQEAASRALYRKLKSKDSKISDEHGEPSKLATRLRYRPRKVKEGNMSDPLLDILCSKPADSKSVRNLGNTIWPESCTDRLGHLREQEDYSALYDLPLLGQRLLELQRFNVRQTPRTSWGLWKDRRNRREWLVFWLVMMVSVVGTVSAVVQVALAAAQLGLAH
jgi:hypothetical protein